HLDVSVFARGLLDRVVTRIYFPDEAAANAADPVLASIAHPARAATLVAQPDPADAGRLRFDIHLQGEHETVFFDVCPAHSGAAVGEPGRGGRSPGPRSRQLARYHQRTLAAAARRAGGKVPAATVRTPWPRRLARATRPLLHRRPGRRRAAAAGSARDRD